MFAQRFTSFLNVSLKFIFLMITIYSLISIFSSNVLHIVFACVIFAIIGLFITYILRKSVLENINYNLLLFIILAVAFLFRGLWIVFIDTKPISDFALMYEYGSNFANGDYFMFRDNNYIARFPHLTFFIVYLGIFHSLFSNPLVAIKIVNLVLSTINVYFAYLISTEVYNERKKGILAAAIAALFPAFIVYNSVVCTENVAMTFFLSSIYIFLLVVKKRLGDNWIFISGLILSIGNLFRSVAPVIVIAYLMYLVIYCHKDKVIKRCSYMLVSFLIPMYLTNFILLHLNITEYPLWKGSEPSITSVLKGTNIENKGMWNEEDANIVEKYNYDYKAIQEAAKEIIKDRLFKTSPIKLMRFYVNKIVIQWSTGDFAGISWASSEVGEKNTIYYISINSIFYIQVIYSILMLLTYLGLYNRKSYRENNPINLIYIIFCGYGLLYLITEMQPRYAYIVSWIFVILPLTCKGDLLKYIASKIKSQYNKTINISTNKDNIQS